MSTHDKCHQVDDFPEGICYVRFFSWEEMPNEVRIQLTAEQTGMSLFVLYDQFGGPRAVYDDAAICQTEIVDQGLALQTVH